MTKLFTILCTTLTLIWFSPVMASDSNIDSVTLNDVTTVAPGETADYSLTFTNQFAMQGSVAIRFFSVNSDGSPGSSTAVGFDLTNATFTSSDIPGTGLAVGNGTEFNIILSSPVDAGTHNLILQTVKNAASEGDYAIGLSATFNSTDSDFTTDRFILSTDPCINVTTGVFSDVAVSIFGTNAQVTRGSDSSAVAYSVAYATTQEALDDNTAETADMTSDVEMIVSDLTAETLYFFAVRALDSNNCTIAEDTVSDRTEKAITNQRYTKPTVNKIQKRSAVVHWVNDDFIDNYSLELWSKSKLLKRFKRLTTLKKILDGTWLKSGKTYKVRVRAKYTTTEKTKWSKFTQFTTD